jgi:integrase
MLSGLTATDLKSLLLTDIDLAAGTVHIVGSIKSQPRTLKLDARQMMPIFQYMQQKKGEQLIEENIQSVLENLKIKLQRSTGKTIPFQQFRDSRISIWLKQYNLRQTQYYAGIKYLSSLERYRKNNVDSLMLKAQAFHPMG